MFQVYLGLSFALGRPLGASELGEKGVYLIAKKFPLVLSGQLSISMFLLLEARHQAPKAPPPGGRNEALGNLKT